MTNRLVVTLPGHDPTLQFLSLADLAGAVLCAVEHDKPGVFNVAPDGVVPLHKAIRMAGKHRFVFPRMLQRMGGHSEALEYLRYSWTVSNAKIKKDLGFIPLNSSASAAAGRRTHRLSSAPTEQVFDEFGMDRNYIGSFGKTLFKFLCDYYWRIEARGLENVPTEGPAVLAGTHRGFMPWDGVMALHLIVQETGRVPRFMTHPGLLKFPFVSNFMAKLGGVVACQASADRMLEKGELLGVFPEGVHGAFALYRNAYQLKTFGRDAFVKLALRHRVPIVPFVTVGSAEIFPIFAKIKSRRWTRYADWPCLPVSTFPFLPFPLPSKWHTVFLPAVHVEKQYPPEAAVDTSVVKKLSLEVRNTMQRAVDEIVQRRRSVFYGSVFTSEKESGPA